MENTLIELLITSSLMLKKEDKTNQGNLTKKSLSVEKKAKKNVKEKKKKETSQYQMPGYPYCRPIFLTPIPIPNRITKFLPKTLDANRFRYKRDLE